MHATYRIRAAITALVLLLAPAASAIAGGVPVSIGWQAEDGALRLRTPVPAHSACRNLDVLVPVTASAVKAVRKLQLRLPPAFPGGTARFLCQGSVYGAPDFCMVFSLRNCVAE